MAKTRAWQEYCQRHQSQQCQVYWREQVVFIWILCILRCVFIEAHDKVQDKNNKGGREYCHTTGSGWKKEVVTIVIWGMIREMRINWITTLDWYYVIRGVCLPWSHPCYCCSRTLCCSVLCCATITKWHHKWIHDHEKREKQAIPNVRIYGIIHMYTTLYHHQIIQSFQRYQNVRGWEREMGTAASAGNVYTIINQLPSASIPVQTHQT